MTQPQSKLIKVCILTTSYPISPASSSGIFVRHFARTLSRHFSIQVVTPDDNIIRKDLENSNLPLTVKPFRYAPIRYQKLCHGAGGIVAALNENKGYYLILPVFLTAMLIAIFRAALKCDLIQANWSICGAIAGICGKLTGTPVYTTLLGQDYYRAKNKLADRIILKTALLLSQNIITISSKMYDELCISYPNQCHKFHFIPNGVSSKGCKASIKKALIPLNQLKLITIGNLIPLKGIDTILQAIALYPSDQRPSLSIVGHGAEKNNLIKLASSLGISSQIRFLGIIDNDDIPQTLAAADGFILASHSEGRPNVILEAMAVGLPVLGSNINGITEIITHECNGYIFQPGGPESLKVEISKLSSDFLLRQKVSDAALTDIQDQKLTWEETANSYKALISNTIADSKPIQ